MTKRLANVLLLIGILQPVSAEPPDFDTTTRIVTIPMLTVDLHAVYADVELLLKNNRRWELLTATHVPASESLAKSLPLLAEGKHAGIIKGFNAMQPAVTNRRMRKRWNEARAKGMRTGRIQLDWSDLEPAARQYDKHVLEEALQAMRKDGLQPFVLISTIDSEEFTLPPDLQESDLQLINGMQLDNPVILERFKRLLDWVVPMAVSYGGWAISVGNEPGNFLDHTPSAQQGFVNFLGAARSHAHAINPALAITMTLAQLPLERGETFPIAFLEQSDVACFNYYAANNAFYFDEPGRVNQEIDQLLRIAGDKYLILQELGAAGGYDAEHSTMMATQEKQQQFFENVFAKMQSEPLFRAAFVFQLVDWDPVLVDTFYTRIFLEEGFDPGFVERFAESLETTGLIRYSDGRKRPAWDTFIKWVGVFSNT